MRGVGARRFNRPYRTGQVKRVTVAIRRAVEENRLNFIMALQRMIKCPTCIGIGYCTEADICTTCEGTGEVPSDEVILDEPCQPAATR